MATVSPFCLVVVDEVLGVVERQVHHGLVVLIDLDGDLVRRPAPRIFLAVGLAGVCASAPAVSAQPPASATAAQMSTRRLERFAIISGSGQVSG